MKSRMGPIRRMTLVVFCSVPFFLTSPASAVPMWSRRYGMACGSCHASPGLQLTDTGLDFLRRGHRLDGDAFDKDFTHLVTAHGEWEYEVQKGESTAFSNPEFHLHAGGALSNYVSAYVDVNLNEDFEAIYAQLTKSFGETTYLTARGGKFPPVLIRNYGLGLMASASNPLIVTDITLDENPFTPSRDSSGLSFAARVKSFFFETGVVNGEDSPTATVANHKDVYATAEYTVPDQVSGVGLYYYRGGYDIAVPLGGLEFDRYDRQGVFANFTQDKFRVAGAYLRGKDRITSLTDRRIRGYYIQADGYPVDWVAPFVRFDDVRTEIDAVSARTRKATVGCAFRLYETEIGGGRVVIEASRRKDDSVSSNAALLNLIFAF